MTTLPAGAIAGAPSAATTARARALIRTRLFDTPAEERFDRITKLAARLLDVPIAMVNLVGDDHQWTKSERGISLTRLPLDQSICRHPVESGVPLEVHDLAADPRFQDNALVKSGAHLRFYAGWPLTAEGERIGALCVLDTKPRELTADQRELFRELAAWAEAEVNNTALNELVAALDERGEQLRALLDAVPEGVLIVDESGTVRSANAAATRVFALAPDSDARLKQVLPDREVGVPPFVSDHRDDGGPSDRLQVAGQSLDGTSFPVQITVSPLRHLPGQRWLVLARDLTADAQAEAELHRQQELTSLILKSAADGIVGADIDGVVLFANAAATEVLSCQESDLVGRSLHATAHHSRPDGSPYPAHECPTHRAVLRGEAIRSHEDLFWRRDGRPVPVEMSVAPIVVGDEVHGAVTTFRDISHRQEIDRLKSEFVGVVSHELRTPLTSIKGSLSLLASGVMGQLPPEQQPLVEMARRNADRLASLVDDILDIERLDAGRMPLRPVDTDAVELARQVVTALAPAAQAAGVLLEAGELDSGPVPVHVDPHRMLQVLTNLVGNAIKFSGSGSPVTVSATRRHGEVRITVEDRGRGIPPEELGTIFDRFRQVPGDDPGTRAGTGLGLAIAQGMVQRSGGRIDVQSEVGRGSTFNVVLPAAEPTEGDR